MLICLSNIVILSNEARGYQSVSGAEGLAGSFTTLGLQGSLVWVVNVPDCEGLEALACEVDAVTFFRNIN